MEEADQYILLFPNMFISLIASTLNDIIYSLYWIVENGRSDMAENLFEHLLKETGPIFLSSKPVHTSRKTVGTQELHSLVRDLPQEPFWRHWAFFRNPL